MGLEINQAIDYQACSAEQLVSLLAFRAHWFGAMEALVGSVRGRDARQIQLTDAAWQAIMHGLQHKNPNVRFQCVQLLDHFGDDRIIEPVRQRLHDWAPRVRKQALHALTCEKCKSTALCPLPGAVVQDFMDLARHDPNMNVRIAAVAALGTLPPNAQVLETLQTILATAREAKLLQAAQQTLHAYTQTEMGQMRG